MSETYTPLSEDFVKMVLAAWENERIAGPRRHPNRYKPMTAEEYKTAAADLVSPHPSFTSPGHLYQPVEDAVCMTCGLLHIFTGVTIGRWKADSETLIRPQDVPELYRAFCNS